MEAPGSAALAAGTGGRAKRTRVKAIMEVRWCAVRSLHVGANIFYCCASALFSRLTSGV